MIPITRANLHFFCRICLCELSKETEASSHDIRSKNLYEILERTAGFLEMREFRGTHLYPIKICYGCHIRVRSMDAFRKKAIAALGVLKITLNEGLQAATLDRLKTICRVCLIRKSDQLSVELHEKLCQSMLDCIGLNMDDGCNMDDGLLSNDNRLPQNLCNICYSILQSFISFRSTYKQSVEYLHSLAVNNDCGILESVKVESQATVEHIPCIGAANDTDDLSMEDVFEFAQEPEIKMEYVESESDFEERYQEMFKNDSKSVVLDTNPIDSRPKKDEFLTEVIETAPQVEAKRISIDTSETDADAHSHIDDSFNKNGDTLSCKPKKPPPIHKGSKKNIKCEKCDKSFYKQVMYEAHLKSAHENVERPFACLQCPSTFRQNSALDRHINLLHMPKKMLPKDVDIFSTQDTNLHVCMTCLRQFKRKDILEQHINTAHTKKELRPFKCDAFNCDKAFGSKRTLLRHKRNHSDERPYACSFCPKRYNSKAELSVHVQRHTTNPQLLCPICKRGKSSAEELERHIAMHEASRQHQCPKCGRIFKKPCHLREHDSTVHLKLRPFKCGHCDKTFATLRTQKEHELLHDPITRPILCGLCNMNFTSESTLSRHMTKDHNQIPKKLRAKQRKEEIEKTASLDWLS